MNPEKAEYAAPGPGQCIVHRTRDGMFMARADPVVAFPEHLIEAARAGTGPPGVSLDGKTLVIAASNQVAAYRLESCGQPGYLLGRLS